MGVTDQDYTEGLDREVHIIYGEWSTTKLRDTIKQLCDERKFNSAGRDLQEMRKELRRRTFRSPGQKSLRKKDYSKADQPDETYRLKQQKMLENPPQRLKLFTRSQLVGGLSPRQEKFCMEYMATGDIVHAYKTAGYAIGKTDSKTRQRAWATLHTNKKIKKRLENAMSENDFTNANRSMETIARHLGMFVDKSEQKVKLSHFSDSDSEDKIEKDIESLADTLGLKVVEGGKK